MEPRCKKVQCETWDAAPHWADPHSLVHFAQERPRARPRCRRTVADHDTGYTNIDSYVGSGVSLLGTFSLTDDYHFSQPRHGTVVADESMQAACNQAQGNASVAPTCCKLFRLPRVQALLTFHCLLEPFTHRRDGQ